MSKTNIIICTTSLNRPDLHFEIMPNWINWITSIDSNKYNIKWFINIDVVDKLEFSFAETVTNYEKLVKNNKTNTNITLQFLQSDDLSSNFLNACKRLATNVEKYVQSLSANNLYDTKIFWLEDDWELTNHSDICLEKLLNSYSSNLTNINLSSIRNNYIHALAPGIFSYSLWKLIHYQAWMSQSTYVDAEQSAGKFYLNNFGSFADLSSITLLTSDINKNVIDKITLENNTKCVRYTDPNISLKENMHNTITLVRLYPKLCTDKGKKYMESNQIIKKNDKYNENFYECDHVMKL